MLVVQTRTRVQGIQAQVRTWLRAPVRMLRKRIQGQDNGGESMSNEKNYPLHPNQSHPPIMTCEIPLEEYESIKRENTELKDEIKRLENVRKVHIESIESMCEGLKLNAKQICKNQRALWLARAERAKEMCQRLLIQGFDPKWEEVERKCRAKAEEYK